MDRRKIRLGLKVIHKHRVGDRKPVVRVSDLAFIAGRPKAILEWINFGGVRTPVYVAELDEAKLHRPRTGPRNVYYYVGVTEDPRYEDAAPREEA
ncbi:MAG: hypothetical protein ACT4P4_17630 [Betaproteobacteria bacterium]